MPSLVSLLIKDENPIGTVYMFPLVQLITLTVMNANNPYTQSKFSLTTLNNIRIRYPIEVSIVTEYLKSH